MPTFKVEWENEIGGCDNPLEAATEAMNDIDHGESLMFTVTNLGTGERFSVDLSESPEDAVLLIKE